VSESEVLAAAEARARALAAGDADALRELHHPDLRWTTHRGEVLDRDRYIAGNTSGELVWHAQRLEDASVAVTGDTAVLTASVVDDVSRAGDRSTFRLHLTQTWVRDENGWRVLAAHASKSPG
jgi:ketosteroid isomerase-like protein